MVERHPPKVKAAGSIPVSRSNGRDEAGRVDLPASSLRWPVTSEFLPCCSLRVPSSGPLPSPPDRGHPCRCTAQVAAGNTPQDRRPPARCTRTLRPPAAAVRAGHAGPGRCAMPVRPAGRWSRPPPGRPPRGRTRCSGSRDRAAGDRPRRPAAPTARTGCRCRSPGRVLRPYGPWDSPPFLTCPGRAAATWCSLRQLPPSTRRRGPAAGGAGGLWCRSPPSGSGSRKGCRPPGSGAGRAGVTPSRRGPYHEKHGPERHGRHPGPQPLLGRIQTG